MSVHAEDDELRRILASYEAVATERVGSGSTVTIPVGLREGRMTEIRLRALRGDIFIRRVEIEFGNGERQQVRMRDRIEAGSVSDAVDLAGESRFIRNVVVTLSDRRTDDNARVQLLAKIDRSRPPRESNTSAPKGWVLIGKHTVTRGEERDVVTVGASAGRFARLGLRVLERDIYLDQIVVTYGSGRAETIRVRRRIEGSNQPVAIELDGERFIRQIELTYEREGRGRGPAIVEIYGEHSASWLRERDRGPDRGGRGDGWTLLGAQRAPLLKNDWDTFNVGTRKGRFKAIGLRALEQTIRVEAIRVTYANGETEDLTFSGTIDAGQATPPFDLRGRAQTIDRILVKHRTRFNFKGEGTLEIWGLR